MIDFDDPRASDSSKAIQGFYCRPCVARLIRLDLLAHDERLSSPDRKERMAALEEAQSKAAHIVGAII